MVEGGFEIVFYVISEGVELTRRREYAACHETIVEDVLYEEIVEMIMGVRRRGSEKIPDGLDPLEKMLFLIWYRYTHYILPLKRV